MCFLECVVLVRTFMRTLNQLELLFACCLEVFSNFERVGAAANRIGTVLFVCAGLTVRAP
jgi:hypothetical protein